MEKYSSLFPFHETGLEREQTGQNRADRHSVILYCRQSPTIMSDIMFTTHLSMIARKRILICSFRKVWICSLFCTVEFEYILIFVSMC